jgi:hypothetical protein
MTVATNASNQTLINAIAAGFDQPSTRDLMIIAAYGASSGGGGGGGATFGNYAGGQPNFTPSGGTGLAVDTSNGTLWEYYSGSWH